MTMTAHEKARRILEVPARRAYELVVFTYVMPEPDFTSCWYVVIEDVPKAELEAIRATMSQVLQDHKGHHLVTRSSKVITRTQFNKAIHAILTQNAELMKELDRLRTLTPDIDSALRTLEMIREEPGYENTLEVSEGI